MDDDALAGLGLEGDRLAIVGDDGRSLRQRIHLTLIPVDVQLAGVLEPGRVDHFADGVHP